MTHNVHLRSLEDIADLLVTPSVLQSLTIQEGMVIAQHMVQVDYSAGEVIFQAGQAERESDFMLLILDGEVQVETQASGDGTVVVDVARVGHLLGEMALLDGAPRSATCRADNAVKAAKLTRSSLAQLLQKEPAIAARFFMAIAKRLADRLRVSNHKQLVLNQVGVAMQQELQTQKRNRLGVTTAG